MTRGFRRGARATALSVSALGIVTSAGAQGSLPSASATAVPSPRAQVAAFECPKARESGTFMHINVKKDDTSSTGACAFDLPLNADGMKKHTMTIHKNTGVVWTFCSTCGVDSEIWIEARTEDDTATLAEPFKDTYAEFVPTPVSGILKVPLANNSWNAAWGRNGLKTGDSKYRFVLKVPNNNDVTVDPRLEIDDSPGLPAILPLSAVAAAAVILGAVAMFAYMRIGRRSANDVNRQG